MSAGEQTALDKVELSIRGCLKTDFPEAEKKIKSSIDVVLCFFFDFYKFQILGVWTDDSTGKSTVCSSRRYKFDSQHPLGDSHPPVTPIPDNLMPSSALPDYQAKHSYT